MDFFQKTSNNSIFEHALNLLDDLQRIRRRSESNPNIHTRPIIFVGHSLGGLVIKQALCKSAEYRQQNRYPNREPIDTYVAGIIFIGTPHRGSIKTSWAKIATNLAKVVAKDHNDRVITALSSGSEVLASLQDSFAGLLSQFKLYSALEEKEYYFGKVVDDTSASIGAANEIQKWIPANHLDMCKFSSNEDIGYQRLAGAVEEILDGLPGIQSKSIHLTQG
jgi:protein SERAC1